MNSKLLRLLAVFGMACLPSQARADSGTDFFESKIRPLLVEHCYECHSGEKTKGGLALDTCRVAERRTLGCGHRAGEA